MKYLCLVYHEGTIIDALTEPEYDAIVCGVIDYCEELRERGYYIASFPLQPAQTVTTIRVRNGSLSIVDSPVAGTTDRLDGMYVIEARDLNDAIRVMSRMPPASLGCIEVRPAEDLCRNRERK